jgi:hypothetical protein
MPARKRVNGADAETTRRRLGDLSRVLGSTYVTALLEPHQASVTLELTSQGVAGPNKREKLCGSERLLGESHLTASGLNPVPLRSVQKSIQTTGPVVGHFLSGHKCHVPVA